MTQTGGSIDAIIQHVPASLFVLTASHNDRRTGALVRWVQRCAATPPMITIAMCLGQSIEPLIRDSRHFALCAIDPEDRFWTRKLVESPRPNDDPFVSLVSRVAPSGSPIVARTLWYLDCELVRHVDLDAGYGLYVGLVHHAGVMEQPSSNGRYAPRATG